jgi:hypothetical protein
MTTLIRGRYKLIMIKFYIILNRVRSMLDAIIVELV